MIQELTPDDCAGEGRRVLRRVCVCGHAVEAEAEAQGPLSPESYRRYLALLGRRLDRALREHRCPLS